MDSILKVVYPNKIVDQTGYIQYLLNGVHPAVIEFIYKKLENCPQLSVYEITEEIKSFNEDSNWDRFFRHSNFQSYYRRHYFNQDQNIVDIDGIKEDGNIYIWPIEVGGSLDDFYRSSTLILDGKTYEYTFVDTINPILLEYIKKGLVKIVINTIHDPLVVGGNLYQIEKYFESHGIDPSNITVIGGNDFQEYYQEYPNGKIKITHGYIMVQQAGERLDGFPYVSSLGYLSDAVRESDLDPKVIRSKRFLCWNRTMRTQRIWLAYLAMKYKLLENSYFSFLNQPGGGLHNIEQVLGEYASNFDVFRYSRSIFDMIPHDLDTGHLPQSEKSGFPTNNNKKEFYLNSYVHITSETIFKEKISCPFFSEKTFHAMVNLQPFIYVGCAGALKILHSWNIKTFHPFIDESYDDEWDPVKRFGMIEAEIKKINEMPIEELHNWYYSITDILLHNQKVLKQFSGMNPFANAINDIKRFYGTYK
jgi:hypothetical protein